MEEQRHLNGGHDNAVNVETDSDVEDGNHVEVLRQSRANGRSQPRMDVSALLGERMLQVICRTCCRHICSQVSIALWECPVVHKITSSMASVRSGMW